MSLSFIEDVKSRALREVVKDGQAESIFTRIFTIYGGDDPSDSALRGMSGLPQPNEQWGTEDLYVANRDFDVLRPGVGSVPGIVRCTVSYGPPQSLPNPDDTEQSIELGTETIHVKQGIAGGSRNYPSGATQFGDAINVTEDGVQGVDIFSPKCLITFSVNRSTISDAYFATVAGLRRKVNNALYKGYAAGTLLYMGMQATRRGTGNYRCKHTFDFSENVTKTIATDAGSQTVVKNGWEYLWFRTVQKDDGTGSKVVNSIASCHIRKVYDTADFSGLSI